MDQGWIKSGHIQGDVLDTFPGSGMANGGRHRVQKWSKNAINGHFVAIRGGIKKKILVFFRKTPKGGGRGLAESEISLSEKTEIFLEFFF